MVFRRFVTALVVLGCLVATGTPSSAVFGDVDEDFEPPLSYEWQTGDETPWEITAARAHSGTHSAMSNIEGSSRMWVDTEVEEGILSFYYYIESPTHYLEVCYGYEEGGTTYEDCEPFFTVGAWTRATVHIGSAYADEDGFIQWENGFGGGRIFIDDVTFPMAAASTAYLPAMLRRSGAGAEEHDLWEISYHLVLWWHSASGYSMIFIPTPPHDWSYSVTHWAYDSRGLQSDRRKEVWLVGQEGLVATYTTDVSEAEYDVSKRTTGYRATAFGSFFDGFEQELAYSVGGPHGWTDATVIKSYGYGEQYTITVTPCWDNGLAGYTTEVYGGPYSGEGVTIGACP